MLSEVENRILGVLSWRLWKSGWEISDEFLKEYHKECSLGALYVSLHHLEKMNFVESREREISQERLKIRGGSRLFEYRLTKDGLRRLVEVGSTALDPSLVPQKVTI